MYIQSIKMVLVWNIIFLFNLVIMLRHIDNVLHWLFQTLSLIGKNPPNRLRQRFMIIYDYYDEVLWRKKITIQPKKFKLLIFNDIDTTILYVNICFA